MQGTQQKDAEFRWYIVHTYSGFEERDGVRSPRRVQIENPASGKMVLTFDKVESGLELGDDVFTLEDPDAASKRDYLAERLPSETLAAADELVNAWFTDHQTMLANR